MTKKEAVSILKVLSTAYPNVYKGFSVEESEEFTNLWVMMFDEYDIKIVTQALKGVIKTNQYPPTIAHVQSQIDVILKNAGNYLSEEEWWENIRKAISNSSYNSVQEFNKLDDITKRLIGSHNVLKELALTDTIQLNTVIKSNYMRSYRNIIAEQKQYDNLPSSAKKLSEELNCNERFKLEDKEVARRSIEESK